MNIPMAEFGTAFEAIGYEVVDSWKVWGPSLKVVGKPEFSAFPCSGFFFRLKEQAICLYLETRS
jgi:hypothetical protein